MCGNKAYFDTVIKCDGGLVTFRDGSTSRVREKGNIRSQRLSNLNDVFLVESFKVNLISMSQLCDAQH